jgi:Flp pilus assembly pilin Flp
MKSFFVRLRGYEARSLVMEYALIALLLGVVVITSVGVFKH